MTSPQNPADAVPSSPKSGIAKKWLVAILVLTFAFVLMPFLLWYMTTFSRPLNDAELGTYFTDAAHPRRAQHALSQVADRITSLNPAIRESAKPWYPEVVKSATDRRLGDGPGQSILRISRRSPEAIDGRKPHGAAQCRSLTRPLRRSFRP